jgi:hypothetical protein
MRAALASPFIYCVMGATVSPGPVTGIRSRYVQPGTFEHQDVIALAEAEGRSPADALMLWQARKKARELWLAL